MDAPAQCAPDEVAPNPCASVDCGGHGTCLVSGDNAAVCLCNSGYHATVDAPAQCVPDEVAPNPCASVDCGLGGVCVPDGLTAVCVCGVGYTLIENHKCISKADDNHNYMFDGYETVADQGKDCHKGHNAECIDFCDSFFDNHCSTKCTSDAQCVSDEYFCRNDGRCAPKVFETIWKTEVDNQKIYFPGGKGECNYTIDWGDGSSQESFTECTNTRIHTYMTHGTYHVKVTGMLKGWTFSNVHRDMAECQALCEANLSEDDEVEFCAHECFARWNESHFPFLKTGYLTEIVSFGPVQLGEAAFESQSTLTKVSEIDIPDLSEMTSMVSMFGDATSFNSNLNRWDTSTITNMQRVFGNCRSFNSPLGNWDTSNVTNISLMFFGTNSFAGDGLANWDVSKVTSYDMTFYNSGISHENWDKMVSTNSGWAAMDKSSLKISY